MCVLGHAPAREGGRHTWRGTAPYSILSLLSRFEKAHRGGQVTPYRGPPVMQTCPYMAMILLQLMCAHVRSPGSAGVRPAKPLGRTHQVPALDAQA